jgi:hypothetical protein
MHPVCVHVDLHTRGREVEMGRKNIDTLTNGDNRENNDNDLGRENSNEEQI